MCPESSEASVRNSLPMLVDTPAVDVPAVMHQAVRALFGAAAVVAEVALRTLAESTAARQDEVHNGAPHATEIVDVVFGLAWGGAHVADNLAGRVFRAATPTVSVMLSPPLVPDKLKPSHLLRQASRRWVVERPGAVRSLTAWSTRVAPAASKVAVNMVDVDPLIVGVMDQVNLQRLAETALSQVDVDALMTAAVADVDITRFVEQVLARLDLTLVLDNVIQSIDLAEVVRRTLDQIDVTALVLERMDMRRVITSTFEQLDMTRLITEQVDLVGVANVIVDGIDLIQIIRDSTGSIASETVNDIRIQGIEADRTVSRFVDRLLLRHREQA